MANYAQTVNVIGCIKTTPIHSGFAATGLPLKLYRNQFGTIPVFIDEKYDDLDIAAALNTAMDKITISFVNINQDPTTINLDLGETSILPEGRQWMIQNNDPEAYNVPGEEPSIKIQESEVLLSRDGLNIPGYAILLVEFNILK